MKNNNEDKTDTSSWSQVRETVLMINTAVARVEYSMIEGNDSVNALSQSFVDIVNSAKQIAIASEELEDSPAKNKIDSNCKSISEGMQNAIIAFQFYDKLSQRLSHVSKSLSSLTDILNDHSKINEPEEWLTLQNMIRSRYTLDADQQMFDDVLNGMSIEEALKVEQQKIKDDDVELF